MKRGKGKRAIAWFQAVALTATATLAGMPNLVQAASGQEEAQAEEVSWESQTQERKILFNEDWRFYLEDGTAVQAQGKDFDDSEWRLLDLPHDYSIEQDFDPSSPAGANGGYLNGGVGWYRKTFTLPESMKGKRISIDFGGVYMDSTSYVNGKMIGNYPYGYSTFSYDITDELVADGVTENVIAVRVNHQQPSSRWYSGSGIYRNVNLVVTDPVHVERYGTFVTTPDLEEHYGKDEAVVSVETKVGNDGELPENAVVTSTIYDSDGNVFAQAVSTEEQEIAPGQTAVYEQTITTEKPELWGVDDPNLYELVSEISVDGEVVDTYETSFGFRWIEMDPNEGFYLNNEYMKLNGVCMHHDQGALGAVANYRAIERQMEIMKDMGVNAIRVTHNPAADELLEICDKMGLMVIDEAFDCWESAKRSKDYARFFSAAATHPDAEPGTTWAEFDIKNMVNRGKNNACVIMWSIGNEIISPSVGTAQKLVNWVAEVDPTRPATQGFNNFIDGFWDSGVKKVAEVTGVVGLNYGERSYDAAHEEYPDWIIMGTETSSAVRSRGWYIDDDERKIRSNYDRGNTVSWGRAMESAWRENRDRKFIMGEFMWTGFDYIGEPSPYHDQYPAKSSYFGAVDTAGIPKDAYYMYQSQWTTVEENPMVHILPHWNWENDDSIKKDGKIAVQAYSNAASVELFLNGESLGEKAFYQRKTSDGRSYQEGEDKHIYLEWQVAYEPGELKAVAKDFDGTVIATDVIKTAGEPAQVRLTPDREVITADGKDLSYILVEILDEEGNLVPTADNNVKFQIAGDGKIVGVDNGDATEVTQSYKGSERKAYSGKAMVIVQSTSDEGSFTLTANSAGLRSDKAKVFTTEHVGGNQLLGYQETETIYVKKGEQPKLPDAVTAVYADSREEKMEVSWETIDAGNLEKAGAFTVEGVVNGTEDTVTVTVIVADYIGTKPVHLVTPVDVIPQMSDTVTAVYNTGEEEKLPVVWETVTQDQVAAIGSFEVKGTVEGFSDISATVRVAESVKGDGADIAKRNGTYPIPEASWVQPNGNDPVSAINNGTVVYRGGAAGERWIPWGHGETDEWVQLEFEEPIETGKVGLDFWNNDSDSAMAMSDRITISYSNDGETWTPVENQSISEKKDFKSDEENIFTFEPVTAKYIRWNFYNEQALAAGVSEVHVYEREIQMECGSSAALESLQVGGQLLDGFDPDQYSYTMELEYGEEMPKITAVTEDPNATMFIVPAIMKDGTATVEVTSEDQKTTNLYSIQFHEKLPTLDTAEIALPDSIMEDDVLPINLTAKLQDGSVLPISVLDVIYTVGNPEIAQVQDGKLYAYDSGNTTLKATVTYQNKTVESNELQLVIEPNPDKTVITGYENVTVETAKGAYPTLPQKIRATYNTGLPKQVEVTWDEIAEEQYASYGTFKVKGSVQGQELRPEATVVVKGVVGVQQFSCATPVGVVPTLPEKATVYNSDGSTDELPVTWEEHPQSLFWEDGTIVTVKGTAGSQEEGLSTQITVRVTSEDVVTGDKFTGFKNGFYWPLGIASFTNGAGSSGDSASELNDNIVSREESGNNRWCNWTSNAREEDWAGIIFGLEEVAYKFIDNLEIDFYTDHGASLPAEYEIQYYDGAYFNYPPEDPDNVTDAHPVGVEENWKPMTNLQAPDELSATETCHFTFDMVQTCAIRIKMKAQPDKCLAITEMGAYEKKAVAKTSPVITDIYLDGQPLKGFDPQQTDYVYETAKENMPEITATAGENSSVTVIYPENFGGKAKVVVTAEDGVSAVTYQISILKTDDVYGQELSEMIRFLDSLSQEEYTAESWAALQKALEAAKAVEADADATRAQIDKAMADLVAAFGNLEYGVQRQHLQAAIDAALEILDAQKDYDAESVALLQKALEKAQAVMGNAAATQEEVNLAASDLLDAIVQVAFDEDLLSLESLIEAVEGLNGDKYTAESWAALQAAAEQARAVLEDSDREDGALAGAYSQLADAIRGLVMKGNKAALAAVIEKAEEILSQASDYTQSSISGLAEALEQAQKVYGNENATQKEVSQAVEALTGVLVLARLKGDVNKDGRVDTGDSAALLRYNAELGSLDEAALEGADVNGDGAADTKDAVLILQRASERIDSF